MQHTTFRDAHSPTTEGPGGPQKAGRSHRSFLPIRWLIVICTCLLVLGTTLALGHWVSFAASPWVISPTTSFAAGDANCPINSTTGTATCSITLGYPAGPGSAINWVGTTKVAKGKGLSGVTFTPANGILSPGETTPLTITIPRTPTACQNGSFLFKNSNNGQTLATASWTCKFTSVVMLVSPTSLGFSSPNCTSTDAGTTCTVTLADPAYSGGAFTWTTRSITGVTATPPRGTLSPNESTPVTLTLTGLPCGSSITFTARPLTKGSTVSPPVTVTFICPPA